MDTQHASIALYLLQENVQMLKSVDALLLSTILLLQSALIVLQLIQQLKHALSQLFLLAQLTDMFQLKVNVLIVSFLKTTNAQTTLYLSVLTSCTIQRLNPVLTAPLRTQ